MKIDYNRFVELAVRYEDLVVPIAMGAVEVLEGVNTLDGFVDDISEQQGVDAEVVKNIMYGVE